MPQFIAYQEATDQICTEYDAASEYYETCNLITGPTVLVTAASIERAYEFLRKKVNHLFDEKRPIAIQEVDGKIHSTTFMRRMTVHITKGRTGSEQQAEEG